MVRIPCKQPGEEIKRTGKLGVGVLIGMRRDFREEIATSIGVAAGVHEVAIATASAHDAILRAKLEQSRLSWSGLGTPYLFSFCQCFAVLLSSILASFIYQRMFLGQAGILAVSAPVGLVSGILFAGAMHIVDTANPHRKLNGLSALRDLSVVWAGVILLITFLAFSLKADETLSRGTIFVFVAAGYIAIVLTRSFTPQLMAASTRLANGRGHHVLVLGAYGYSAARHLMDELVRSGHGNISYMEINLDCDDTKWRAELPVVLGKIFSTAREHGRGDICIAADGFTHSRLDSITASIRVIPRAVRVIPEASAQSWLRLPIQSIGGLRSLELQKSPMNRMQRAGKRAVDLAVSVPMLFLIAPFLAAIALTIKLDSRGPVFFFQARRGYRGELFSIVKFRTMNVLENGSTITQAQRNDQRVTGVGRWLRRLSLDELPQLLNVIHGTMSLVGPRPHAAAHDDFYEKCVIHYEVRQHVKPGITGWAQVNGLRGETASTELMRQRVVYDIWYAQNASLRLDFKILLLTAAVILGQRNAY